MWFSSEILIWSCDASNVCRVVNRDTLTALIPRPGVNLTRYHGVFAPNSPFRAVITPRRRGKRGRAIATRIEPEKRRSMTWARRFKRVFHIDIEKSVYCGGAVKIIAGILDPSVICRILDHLKRKNASGKDRAPPSSLLPGTKTAVD